MTMLNQEIESIALAALLGAVLGLEREWSGKSAGFRTMALVSLGAALFTIVSYQMALSDLKHNSDVTRIASNIVTGIGFIGAGLIFKTSDNIHGLTTAATVWAAAAIGMAAGIGNYSLAAGITGIIWVILVIMHYFEKLFAANFETRHYTITHKYITRQPLTYQDFFPAKGFTLLSAKQEKVDAATITSSWKIRAPRKKHDAVLQQLLQDDRIEAICY